MKIRRKCHCGDEVEVEVATGEPDALAQYELQDFKTSHAECFRILRDALKAQADAAQEALQKMREGKHVR